MSKSITSDYDRVVRRTEMEDYFELNAVELINRGFRNHIRKYHPIRWQWIRFKAHWRTLRSVLNQPWPAAKTKLWGAVKEFVKSEEGRPPAPRAD